MNLNHRKCVAFAILLERPPQLIFFIFAEARDDTLESGRCLVKTARLFENAAHSQRGSQYEILTA